MGKESEPKTVSGPEAPTAEVAPKLGNNSSEEVVVGSKEMQYWRDMDSNKKIIGEIAKRWKRHLNINKLLAMKRDTLMKYVESKVGNENKIGSRNR